MIPSDWQPIQLKDVVQKGRKICYGIVQPGDFTADGIPLIRGKDYSFGWVPLENFFRVSEAIDRPYKRSKVKPRDLILTIVGAGTGNVATIPDWLDGANITQTTARIAVDHERFDHRYVRALLQSRFGQNAVYRAIKGGAQPGLNIADVEKFTFFFPEKSVQSQIADVAEVWGRAIETVEALIANARAQKQALMQQLLDGKHRLPGFSGEWQRKPINEIATRVTRRNDGTELPVLTISSTSGFVRQDEKYSRYMAGKSVETYIMLNEGEFAYNKGNSKTYEFGCIFDLEGYERALVPHVYVCFKLKKGYSHRFYKALFEADYLAPQLGRLVNTGVRNNGLLNIKPSEFLGTKVPVPPPNEQDAIAAVMEAASRTVIEHETQLTALRQEKAALMQQLLTGKRRVNLPENEAA
ncbi:restriction endonuclease subunit S [Aurantiacibacter poecillastricola]|uniref:restriction endonuclease subunit S n=1 Tax=Aurantiacibacter poecillastricola TaxID=3064385 RepID=UPI00273F715D|nr:restriction endonuclease subunit S [Aurantiacibacter sp. 219JJ12-13]MDP5260615.1 restriction endonuclease subunit S [Aurantiacibacter sp. 219JJ12-13]